MMNMERYGRKLAAVYDFIDLDYTAQVKQIKSTMYVVFNRLREKFIVMDKDQYGQTYIFMVVQDERGGFLPFDSRTLEIIRKAISRPEGVRAILRELEESEARREALVEKEADELVYAFADTIKWAGSDVVPSTTWRDRTSNHLREKIRASAE